MKKEMKDPITWIQFNNIVPIVTSAIIIALSWAALTTRLSLIEQKVDYIANTLEKHYQQADVRDNRLQELEKLVAVIREQLGR